MFNSYRRESNIQQVDLQGSYLQVWQWMLFNLHSLNAWHSKGIFLISFYYSPNYCRLHGFGPIVGFSLQQGISL